MAVIICTGVTLGNGGEHAELRLPGDAGAVPVTLEETTPSDDGHQRFYGYLAQPVDACEGATLWLWTHGATPETELYPVHSDKLTVLAGATPVPTTPTVTAINGGGTFYAGDNRIEGTNIRFADAHPASHIVLKNGEGQVVTGVELTDQGTASETEFHVIVADNEGTLADGADYTWEFAMVDSQGNPVTVTKTARWVSE